jgi:tetratricopeptide (TPR) repeat protein
VDARAHALARDGLRAAGEGRLHHAANRLGEAVRLNGADAASRAVLGLCRLALGDAPGARAAWRDVESDDCAAWLRSLDDGELRDAFRAHDAALAAARDGDHPAALAALDRALSILPDLVPAGRLRGLVLLAQGDAVAAREAWSAHLAACRDDPALLRLLAETPAPAAAPAPVVLPVAETPRPVRPGRVAPFALGAGTAAAAAALVAMLAWPAGTPTVSPAPFRDGTASAGSAASAGSGSTAPAAASPASASASPASSASPAPSALPASGWEAYRLGRDAHGREDWAAAAAALEASVAAGKGRFYHDDALYLLARSLARAGRAEDARAAAGRLLREHADSPFHNRVARAIAATGAEPAD